VSECCPVVVGGGLFLFDSGTDEQIERAGLTEKEERFAVDGWMDDG